MIQLIVDYAKTRVSGDCMPLEIIKKPLAYSEKVFLTKRSRAKAAGNGFNANKPMIVERYLYDEFDNTFPTGMLNRVIAALEKHQFLYEIHDLRTPTQSSVVFAPPVGKYADKKARPYQQDAIDTALFKKRGILRIACGGGKTLCAGEIIKNLGRRTVFLVNRGGLLYQAKEVFEEMLGGRHIGQIGDGIVDVQDINVVMIQTLTKYLGKEYEIFDEEDTDEDPTDVQKYGKQIQEMLDSAELVFMDECHCIGAKTAFECLTAFKNAEWRIGLSVGGDSVVVIRDAKHQIKVTTIKEIADGLNVGLDKIVMVEDGTQVRTYDGQKFVWRNLNAVHRYKCNKKVFELLTDYGRKLRVTEDHSVFRVVRDGYRAQGRKENQGGKYYGKIEEARGDALSVGDYLLLEDSLDSGNVEEIVVSSRLTGNFYVSGDDRDFSEWINKNVSSPKAKWRYKNGKHGAYLPLSMFLTSGLSGERVYTESARGHWVNNHLPCSAIAYMVGYFIGDGWLCGHRTCFAVPKNDKDDFLSKIKDLLLHANVSVNVQEMKGKSVEIRLGGKALYDVFYSMFGKQKVKTKRIPSEIFNWTKASQELVLQGIIESDGMLQFGTRQRNRVYYTTISERLALDLCEFLKIFGIIGSISSTRKPCLGGIVNGRQIKGKNRTHVVHWSHWAQIGQNEGKRGRRMPLDMEGKDGRLAKIKKITEVHEDEVFDLSVDNTENFVANGILVHNSATPVREDGKDLFFEACFGPKLVNISFTYLIENGFLVRPFICFVKLNGSQLPLHTTAKHSTIYSKGIVGNEFRNRMAIAEAKMLYLNGHHPLMLVQHVKHGNILKSYMPEAGFIHGKDSIIQRKEALDKFCIGEIPILIATTILDEAIDIPPCDSIIMTGGGASYVRTIQRISRGMRIDPNNPNKKFCVVIDFFDQDKYLDRHCFVRQNTYRSEKAFKIILPGQPRPFDEDVF